MSYFTRNDKAVAALDALRVPPAPEETWLHMYGEQTIDREALREVLLQLACPIPCDPARAEEVGWHKDCERRVDEAIGLLNSFLLTPEDES